jgi:NADH:ubiquinone oxidoreductase subunit
VRRNPTRAPQSLTSQSRSSANPPPPLGDTKAGTLIGTDRWGNKYFENLAEELPLRTRWVDYKSSEFDAAQIEPGWHAWMSYLVDTAPSSDPLLALGKRVWETEKPIPNFTQSRGAYRPYST